MSEDRHTFSEPRPVPGLDLPTWDVDVYRDNVPEPILTLRVDEKNLPPRKSKKKKVVWKLPDSIDQTPRFGIDEKRRLLDIFKSLKKERRKSKRGSAVNMDPSSFEDAKSDDDGNEVDTNMSQEQEKLVSDVQRMSMGQGSSSMEPPPVVGPTQSRPTNGIHNTNKIAPAPPGIGNAGNKRKISTAPPGLAPQTAMNGTSAGAVQTPQHQPPINRAQSRDGLCSPPPPGLTPVVPAESRTPPQIEEPPLLNQQHLQPQPPPLQSQAAPPPASAPPPSLNPMAMPLLPPARFLKFPAGMHPDIFGNEVANLYITLTTTGQVDELLMYYTLTAQKSLSLKSAKSICQTPIEMKAQLQSLAGCVFAVQGITVQQGLNSLLLIWSGICKLQGQQHGFCHTIVLVPLPTATQGVDNNSMQYQIQNDALVLLTND